MKIKNKSSRAVRTVFIMMAATVLSKLLGLLRSSLLGSHYGTGTEAAAFTAAQRIPFSFFDLMFSAAIIGCFIPVYNSFKENEREKASEFAHTFLNLVLLATSLLALLGIIFAPALISLIAPKLGTEASALAVKLLRILFPSVIFTGAAYTLVGVMQSKGRFVIPALISAISNGFIVAYFLFFDNLFGENGIYALTVVYLLSWVLQLGTLVIPLFMSGSRPSLMLKLRSPALRQSLKMLLPIMAGSWLIPAGALSGTFFSTFAQSNGSAFFEYSNNIYIMAAGILTYSICNYIFPALSRLSDETESFCNTVRTGLSSSAMLILPFTALLIILAGEGVSIIYLRGAFTPSDAKISAGLLRCMASAMPPFAAIEILSRVFYSRKQLKAPVLAAVTGVAVNIASGVLFVNAAKLGMTGVGISSALGQYSAAAVLVVCASRIPGRIFDRKTLLKLLKTLILSIISAAAMIGIYALIGNDPYRAGTEAFGINVLVCAAVLGVGCAVYALPFAFKLLIGYTKKRKNADG